MKTIEHWDTTEWEAIRKRLKRLSRGQLQAVATRLGIRFADGNAVASKEDLILVMDEASKADLKKALVGLERHIAS